MGVLIGETDTDQLSFRHRIRDTSPSEATRSPPQLFLAAARVGGGVEVPVGGVGSVAGVAVCIYDQVPVAPIL
jgi:hypothetical protein